MTAPRAVLRADASPQIGGGHVMRCLALAEALRDDGWAVLFASSAETRATIAPALRGCIPWHWLDQPDLPAATAAAAPLGCELLVIDHYGLDASFESACRPWARQVLVVDDLADRPHACDFLVDPTLGRSDRDYAGIVPVECTILAGSAYALLRPAFGRARATRRRRQRAATQQLFLSLGQTDAGGVVASALDALATHLPGVAVDIAIAASAPGLPGIEQAAGRHGRATVHRDATDIAALMAGAEVALVTASGTAAEAACLGLPIVALETAANQRALGRALADKCVADVALSTDDAVAKLVRLLADESRRCGLGRIASSHYDGLGAKRVALAVRPERTKDGAALWLRPVTRADADLLLAWQQAPETRRYARNPQPPSAAAHAAWLSDRLSDPACVFHIVLCNNKPVGAVRLDRQDEIECAYEISILTAPGEHNRGIGRGALHLVRRLLPDARLDAEVLAGNLASHRMFETAGFVRDGYTYRAHPRDRMTAQ